MLAESEIPTHIIQSVSADQAWHFLIFPYQKQSGQINFYLSDDRDLHETRESLEVLLGERVALVHKPSDEITELLGKYYRRGHAAKELTSTEELEGKNFLSSLIQEAARSQSSDIHLEPYENRCRIRFRIDGALIERYQVEKQEYLGLVNKIKIQANLDIAEKRLPQDGRIFFQSGYLKNLDIRVSILPTIYGEKIVLRLLRKDAGNLNLALLGMREAELLAYTEGIKRPHGIILISGPTGSGKTTTLYATLREINKTDRNILTIEDPVEYTLEGINQVQLKESIGLDFPSALRTFLRQDPDVIMVGEIRDKETATMAIRASLTGHLVLSTIHTNSAWGIIARLLDMGVPGYMIADTLNTAVAQRLIRLLCPNCKTQCTFNPAILPAAFQPVRYPDSYFLPKGCQECYFTGYKGRKAIYEVISMDREFARMAKEESLDVSDLIARKKISLLKENAYALFLEGSTSIDEIYPILTSS